MRKPLCTPSPGASGAGNLCSFGPRFLGEQSFPWACSSSWGLQLRDGTPMDNTIGQASHLIIVMAQESLPCPSVCPGYPHSKAAGFTDQGSDSEPGESFRKHTQRCLQNSIHVGMPGCLPRSGGWMWAPPGWVGCEITIRKVSGMGQCKDSLCKLTLPH